MPSKVQVVFAPGVLEEMAELLSPEEQQSMMDEIARIVNSEEFLMSGDAVDINELDPEMAEHVMSMLAGDRSVDHTLH